MLRQTLGNNRVPSNQLLQLLPLHHGWVRERTAYTPPTSYVAADPA